MHSEVASKGLLDFQNSDFSLVFDRDQSEIETQSGGGVHGEAEEQVPDGLQVRSAVEERQTEEDSGLLPLQIVTVQVQEDAEAEEAEDEVLLLQELSLRVSYEPVDRRIKNQSHSWPARS